MWFSKAEVFALKLTVFVVLAGCSIFCEQGDTIENVTQELEAIMTSGCYKFVLGRGVLDRDEELLSWTSGVSDECVFQLTYTLQTKSFTQRQSSTKQPLQGNSDDVMMSLSRHLVLSGELDKMQSLSEQVKGIERLLLEATAGGQTQLPVAVAQEFRTEVRLLSGEELDDFVRKLGFMQGERGDQQQSRIREFLRKNELLQDMFKVCCQLHRLGDPKYRGKQLSYSIASSIADIQVKLKESRHDLKQWERSICELRTTHKELLFFNVRQILTLTAALMNENFGEATSLVSALFSNRHESQTILASKVSHYCWKMKRSVLTLPGSNSPASPFQQCGKFLNELVNDDGVQCHVYPKRRSLTEDSVPKGHTVHIAHLFSPDQVLRLLFQIYEGLPESFEVMRCTTNTTREEVDLFFQRTTNFENRTFVMFDVNHLTTDLQEQVLRFQLDSSTSQSVRIHYILTGHCIFHEAPWIKVRNYKDHKPELSDGQYEHIYKRRLLQDCGIEKIELVFGRAGDGKSHHIKKQMKSLRGDTCTIAVNEAFSVRGAIQKLQQLNLQQGNCVYFNVTISPSGGANSEEAEQYQSVMADFHWFLFDLFGIGFVQDPVTGNSFRLRTGYGWRVFVEVPSVPGDDNARVALASFLDLVPFLKYIGSEYHVRADDPFDIDKDTQLVCKYLKALKNRRHINRLYRRKQEVRFSTDPDLTEQECRNLLLDVMAEHVKDRKIMQQLFVKYMNRRCNVLEHAPGFNFNEGKGVDADKRTGRHSSADTSELGSTLLSTMLKEVNSFCHPSIQEDWRLHSHQQLVYDFKNGQASFLFLSINPDKLDLEEREKLEKIGIEIPSLMDLKNRQRLDEYLSSALDVDLEKYQVSSGDLTKFGLALIDEEKYVLTVDYTVKMLDIHERRMCGMPVVIEGETGVGKTALVRMLSLLWNHSLKRSRRIALETISELLQRQVYGSPSSGEDIVELGQEVVDAVNNMACCINTGKTPIVADINRVCSVFWKDIKKVLLNTVDMTAMYLLGIDSSLVINAKEDDTPMSTARLLKAFLTVQLLNTFYKLSVHAALTPENIAHFFNPIFQQAEELRQLTRKSGGKQPPTVVVFLDEINTSSCMGLFKELLVDRSLDGSPIPSNVFLVAACNPHRGSSAAIRSSSEHDDWILGSYYVRSLPPSLRFLVWDYGALDDNQEHDYIQEKIAMNQGEVSLEVVQHTSLIAKCQYLIRQFAVKQLVKVGFSSDEAVIRGKSCVSQRDIQRVFSLAAYFEKSFQALKLQHWHARHAILVSLGIVYYLRLDNKYRKRFSAELSALEGGTSPDSFLAVFNDVIDYYVNQMHIPPGIAKTRALKENLFATVVCTACCLPLIIVGAPGSSKTLSFNLTLVNMKGGESRSPFFRHSSLFPALDPYHYQCSRRSTSLEIESVFKRAVKRQQNHSNSNLRINCVVFMDEAGLPEESHESLKVLHYYLDDPQVSFVAITNHILDAAKSNRAVSLFRPQADEDDLQTLARGCLCSDPSNPSAEMQNIVSFVDKFCSAYRTVMQDKQFENFFGLRDFIHFIGYIRRHRGSSTELTPGLVLKALERNFSGVAPDRFRFIADTFLQRMDCSLADIKQRNIVEVLKESLDDVSLALSGDNDGIEAEVRYKLIIDTSEDDSMARLLFMHGVLDNQSTRTFTCSDFPDDGDIQKVHIISAIKHAALEGRTVILRQTDDINESFYDLFNQHFRRIDDPKFEGGRRYYANIAIGSHSKPCRVDPKFQCIVLMHASEVKDAPAPFLNRFEKFLVSQQDLLQISIDSLPMCVGKLVSLVQGKARTFQETIGRLNFYGATEDTLQSLLLKLLPPPRGREIGFNRRLWPLVQLDSVSADADDSEEDDDSCSTLDETLWNQQAPKIIESLEDALRSQLGFQFPRRTADEHQFQTSAIFSAVLKLFEASDGRACKQELAEDPKRIQSWLAKGLLDLSRRPHTTSGTAEGWQYETTITRNSSFAVAMFVQWTVFHVCSSLLKIMTPEALIVKCGQIPQQYVLEYLNFQPHFSLKEVVSRANNVLPVASQSISRVICFTRTTSALHSLPSSYPPSPTESADSHTVQMIESLLPEVLINGMVILKLESIRTLEAFTNALREFMANSAISLFLAVANMQCCSQKRINQVRALIEECQLSSDTSIVTGSRKRFIVLLHFPPGLGHTQPCYPTLFVHGWEHIYLDGIGRGESTDIVDVCHWMRVSCAPAQGQHELSSDCTSDQFDSLLRQLREGLIDILPHAVDVAVSRVMFGNSENCHLNRKMDARKRAETLLQLLNKLPVLLEVLCEKFASAWDLNAIAEQLSLAAHSQLEQDSCLTVSERVQSRFKTLFHNYLSLSLYQLNRDYNLEILFGPFDSNNEEVTVNRLFVEIFKTFSIPKLEELRFMTHTFDSRQSVHRLQQSPVFPFFRLVAQETEQALDSILVEINEGVASSLEDMQTKDAVGEKTTFKHVTLRDIENRATVRLLQFLKEPDDKATSNLLVAQLACQAIAKTESMWERYLADFAQVKLHCHLGRHGSQEHRLLSAWLCDLQKYTADQRFVALHIIARLRQKSISSVVAVLRPLESLEFLHPTIKPSNITIMTESGQELEGQLYTYIINVMYGYLENMLSSTWSTEGHELSSPEVAFMKWCVVYQNLSASLPAMILYQSNDVYVQTKLQAIHVVFVFMRALRLDKSVCAAVMNLALEVCQTCDVQAESIKQAPSDVRSLSLSSIVESGLTCLRQAHGFDVGETPGPSIVDSFFRSASNFVEDVLSLYFPSLPSATQLLCSSPDCYWFLNMINSQKHWSVEASEQSAKTIGLIRRTISREKSISASNRVPVGLVHFKVVEQCLTQLLLMNLDIDQKTGFSSGIRHMVGAVLCECSRGNEIGPFIPTCYLEAPNTTESCIQQPLASVYFHCCLNQLNMKLSNAGFPHLLGLIEQYDKEIQSSKVPDLAVLHIERQAITQIVIKNFSMMFEPGSIELLKPHLNEYVVEQVNQLFGDQKWGGSEGGGHMLAFLHHLSNCLRSTRSLISIFTDHFDACCKPFPWMQAFSSAFKEKPTVQSLLFPFMPSDSADQTYQSHLYVQVSQLVDAIAQAAMKGNDKDEMESVSALCDFCRTEASEDNICHLRIVLWLSVYYRLYEKKIHSNHLAMAVYTLDFIGLDERQSHLLACFAVPQRMLRLCEPSNPTNPDEVRLELHGAHVRRRRQSRNRAEKDTDPLWDFFDPSSIEDPSNVDLRRTLALLVAIVVGLPTRSTHLWSHLFEPAAIEGTFVAGNMYPNAVKHDGLLYDCGCELTADGDYGRADYAAHAQRGTLNLHSLYLLLWINFGAFCLSLLTQPGAQGVIKGRVISEWQSVRHYCLSQLKMMWMLMRDNLSFSDEERTFFVTTALRKFFEVAQRSHSPLHGAIFTDPGDLDRYERAFHVEVLQPTWQKFEDKHYLDDTIWQQHPLLMSMRAFSATYPVQPSYKDFLHSLEHVQGAGHTDTSQQLSVLCKFVREKQRLRIGGLLLPDLIEFYVWLHQQLSHLMTVEQALDMSVGDVVERLANRYSKHYAEYIRRLFSRVQENYNKYVEVSGGAIGQGACLLVRKENQLRPIDSKNTKLAQLLSDTEEEGECPDALFVVIRTLVTTQNDFVQAVMTDDSLNKTSAAPLTIKFLPVDQGEVSALELGWHNCLMGDITLEELQPYLKREVDSLGDEPGVEFMKIIRRHHLYLPGTGISNETGTASDLTASLLANFNFKSSTMFEFYRLQQDVVMQFIAGKPFISDPAQTRIVFRYRQQQTVQLHHALRSSDNAEAHVDLPTLQHELPEEFKSELSASQLKELDIAFHSLNYRDSVEVMKALRAVAGHLCQAVMEVQGTNKQAVSEKCQELAGLTIGDFLLRVYNETSWSPELEARIGLPLLADHQRDDLLRSHLSDLYHTLETFFLKLHNGEYEFSHLPLTLKAPLSESGKEAINNLPAAYTERGEKPSVVPGLTKFDQTLLHAEKFLEQEAKKSLHSYLVENKFYDAVELPVCCLPEDIRVEHYMHVRLATQRVLSEILAKGNVSLGHAEEAQQWSDIVTSLLDEFPQLDHMHRPGSMSGPSQLPVFVLGSKRMMHHCLWFEEASKGSWEEERADSLSDDSDEDDQRNEFPTLRPIEISNQSNPVSLYSTASTTEENEDSVRTLQASGPLTADWEDIVQSEEEHVVDEAKMPVAGNTIEEKELTLQLSEAAAESIPPAAAGSLALNKLLELYSPDEKQSLARELLGEKDLSSMSVGDVARFLETNGFGDYVESFKENDIDGGVLQELNNDSLKDLGVRPLHCSKIIKLVKQEKKKT